jgi:hypothetical protein
MTYAVNIESFAPFDYKGLYMKKTRTYQQVSKNVQEVWDNESLYLWKKYPCNDSKAQLCKDSQISIQTSKQAYSI